ncbi:MAG: hypothetical protein IT529_12330 [Burkholderiales bacterium]|nr:hypothetical protein [Burkholderiales bacterium]
MPAILHPAGPAARFWRRVRSRFGPALIETPAGLATYVEERALFIAQKCAIDYCRGKTGLASYALFTEDTFLNALEICRWEGFAAVLGDLCILVEGHLRPHAPPERRARLADALLGLHAGILAAIPAPVYRPQGWGDVVDAFGPRLRNACATTPRGAADIADHSARRLFETLPIHSSMRELDEEVVYGAVRFRMIALNQEMRRRLGGAALVEALAAGGADPG